MCHTYSGDSRRMNFEGAGQNKFIVFPYPFFLYLVLLCGTMWSECLKTCSPSRDLKVVWSFFLFCFVSEESRIWDPSCSLLSFFVVVVSVCCCFCYILKCRQQDHHPRPLCCIFSLLFRRRTVPPRVFIRPYIYTKSDLTGRVSLSLSFSGALAHTRTRQRKISRWPLASTACACVRVCRTRHQHTQKLLVRLATVRLAGRRI